MLVPSARAGAAPAARALPVAAAVLDSRRGLLRLVHAGGRQAAADLRAADRSRASPIPTSCRCSARSTRRTRSCASAAASAPARAAPTTASACSVNEDCPGGVLPDELRRRSRHDVRGRRRLRRQRPVRPAVRLQRRCSAAGPLVLPRRSSPRRRCRHVPGHRRDVHGELRHRRPVRQLRARGQLPVALDSLREKTATLRGFTASEAVAGQDCNGDGDQLDTVVDAARPHHRRRAGARRAGRLRRQRPRASSQIQQPPFSFPALAVENDVSPSSSRRSEQNRCVENGDEDPPTRSCASSGSAAARPTIEPAAARRRRGAEDRRAALAVSNGTRVRAQLRGGDGRAASPSAPASGRRVWTRTGFGRHRCVYDRPTTLCSDGRLVGRAFRRVREQCDQLLGPGGDTNGEDDVFVRDRQTGMTERVSVGPGGVEADASLRRRLDLRRRPLRGLRELRTNLLGPAATPTASPDVFVRDRQTGTTERVSVGPAGPRRHDWLLDPAISADGRFVAFASDATQSGSRRHERTPRRHGGQMSRHLRPRPADRHDRARERRPRRRAGRLPHPSIRVDLRRRALRGVRQQRDQPARARRRHERLRDVFVHDRQTGTTERVSVGPEACAAERSLSDEPVDLGGRPLRRVPQHRHQPARARGRHQRGWATSSSATG